eukprot:3178964-Rhodomonas_salina.3
MWRPNKHKSPVNLRPALPTAVQCAHMTTSSETTVLHGSEAQSCSSCVLNLDASGDDDVNDVVGRITFTAIRK